MEPYRGRLAPTPSGALHLGHVATFDMAARRAREAAGQLVMRIEDIDRARCTPQLTEAMLAELRWLGFTWDEGPDVGGPHAPYVQSERLATYREAWERLCRSRTIYPSPHSRGDIQTALVAPHDDGVEPLFPIELRPPAGELYDGHVPGSVNWRFRVPDGRSIVFTDGRCGTIERTAGRDFGDFLVWRKDGFPAYELAVVADDAAMQIGEVVRGEDLLTSTARQLLLYEALAIRPPAFYHCALARDAAGKRLAKRDQAAAVAALRTAGATADDVLQLARAAVQA